MKDDNLAAPDEGRLLRLELLRSKILLLSELSEERLDDASWALGLDLDVYHGEVVQRAARAAWDPCEQFLMFRAHVMLGSTDVCSELSKLSPQELCLAAAWIYLEDAQYFAGSKAHDNGWALQVAREHAFRYECAVQQLIATASGAPWRIH